MIQLVQQGKRSGTIRIPSSKSDAQRVLLLAALTRGKSILRNTGNSADEQAMLEAIRLLGAQISVLNERELEIEGISQTPRTDQLSLGESGLGFRLMASVLALFDREITLEAQGSLLQRPMDFFEQVLPKLGAQVRSFNGFPPLTICGPLRGNEIMVDGSLSSQFLSGLLIALPLAEGNSILHVRDLKSIPYIDMTLRSLEQFGIKVRHYSYERFEINGNQHLKPCNYTIEGDWSSAAFWLVASALGMDISVQNLNLESLQADRQILDVFRDANCEVVSEGSLVHIDGTKRKAFEADLTHAPDLFPALAVFASLTPGKSILHGTKRLIHKESNRAQAIVEEFGKMGCQISLSGNEMYIEGILKPRSSKVDSHHDHRMAMSLAILALFAPDAVEISGAESVSKSYPSFWEDLASLEG
ncbi:MAG: 3-phosphoshikimate 1-carboxyvinyltransferase [Bacteroidota bacterium]